MCLDELARELAQIGDRGILTVQKLRLHTDPKCVDGGGLVIRESVAHPFRLLLGLDIQSR